MRGADTRRVVRSNDRLGHGRRDAVADPGDLIRLGAGEDVAVGKALGAGEFPRREHPHADVHDDERLAADRHDDEAESIWRDAVGVPAERIQRLDEDNYWRMADTGPNGPCSEIFWDKGAEFGADGGPARAIAREVGR